MRNPIWKKPCAYLLVLVLLFVCGNVSAQITVTQFNAGWNDANGVSWLHSLEDCRTIAQVDISKEKELQKKHKIAVIPTIIIFKDNEEVARFQADLSFKMVATKKEVQEEISNQLMSDF